MTKKPILICECGKNVNLEGLPSNNWDDYSGKCECGRVWQVRDVTAWADESELTNTRDKEGRIV